LTNNLYGERASSQIPAVELLMKLGYEYITPEKAN